MFNERNYSQPKYVALFTCEERARLERIEERWKRGFYQHDGWLDSRRLAFARRLVEQGRIGEGIEGDTKKEGQD